MLYMLYVTCYIMPSVQKVIKIWVKEPFQNKCSLLKPALTKVVHSGQNPFYSEFF